jgi:hypothetical protein
MILGGDPGILSSVLKILALCAALVLAATGCSSSEPSSSASASASPTSNSQVLPPVEVSGPTNLIVDTGAFLNVTTPEVSKVTTDNPAVLEVSQPRDDGSAQFNAGAKVVSPGKATLAVFGTNDKELYKVEVTAQDPETIAPQPSQ